MGGGGEEGVFHFIVILVTQNSRTDTRYIIFFHISMFIVSVIIGVNE